MFLGSFWHVNPKRTLLRNRFTMWHSKPIPVQRPLGFANTSLLPALPPQTMSTLLLLNGESSRRMWLCCTNNNSNQSSLWLATTISLPMCYHDVHCKSWRWLMEVMTTLTWLTMTSMSCLACNLWTPVSVGMKAMTVMRRRRRRRRLPRQN